MAKVLRALQYQAGVGRLCTSTAAKVSSRSLSSSFPVDDRTPLYRRLSALGGAPAGSVKKTMNKWLREGKSIGAKVTVQYVKELRKYGRYMHALELMEWMDSRGMNMSYTNHALRLDLVSKVNGVDSAEKYFNNLPEAARNDMTYGSLLHIYCKEKATEKAITLFEKMKELKFGSNAIAYNNMMNLYVSIGQPEKLATLVSEMQVKNIPKNSHTYNIIITNYASKGDIESAEKVMRVAKSDSFSLNWPIYSNLASMYINSGDTEKAESALKRVEEMMDKMDREAYHHLISLFARLGNLDEILRVWNTLKDSMKPTNMSYITLLRALNAMDAFDALELHFNVWDSSYVTYDMRLVNVMIGAYLRKGMRKEAELLLDEAIRKGVEPDKRSHELFINFYLKSEDIDLALKYFEAAVPKTEGWKINQSVIDSLSRYFEERKDTERAEQFRQNLSKLCNQDSHIRITSAACAVEEVNEPCPKDDASRRTLDVASTLKNALDQLRYR